MSHNKKQNFTQAQTILKVWPWLFFFSNLAIARSQLLIHYIWTNLKGLISFTEALMELLKLPGSKKSRVKIQNIYISKNPFCFRMSLYFGIDNCLPIFICLTLWAWVSSFFRASERKTLMKGASSTHSLVRKKKSDDMIISLLC